MCCISDRWCDQNNLGHSRKDAEQIVSMIFIQLVNSIWVAEQKNDGQQMFLDMFPSALSEYASPVDQWVTVAYKSSPCFEF